MVTFGGGSGREVGVEFLVAARIEEEFRTLENVLKTPGTDVAHIRLPIPNPNLIFKSRVPQTKGKVNRNIRPCFLFLLFTHNMSP